ncbi:MAG: hypothetical protein ABH873_03680 [Candidatus Firestonebacteria bacterium]
MSGMVYSEVDPKSVLQDYLNATSKGDFGKKYGYLCKDFGNKLSLDEYLKASTISLESIKRLRKEFRNLNIFACDKTLEYAIIALGNYEIKQDDVGNIPDIVEYSVLSKYMQEDGTSLEFGRSYFLIREGGEWKILNPFLDHEEMLSQYSKSYKKESDTGAKELIKKYIRYLNSKDYETMYNGFSSYQKEDYRSFENFRKEYSDKYKDISDMKLIDNCERKEKTFRKSKWEDAINVQVYILVKKNNIPLFLQGEIIIIKENNEKKIDYFYVENNTVYNIWKDFAGEPKPLSSLELLDRALLYYKHNSTYNTILICEKILKDYPKSKEASEAKILLSECYYLSAEEEFRNRGGYTFMILHNKEATKDVLFKLQKSIDMNPKSRWAIKAKYLIEEINKKRQKSNE